MKKPTNWIEYAQSQELINPGHGVSLLVALGYHIKQHYLVGNRIFTALTRNNGKVILERFPK